MFYSIKELFLTIQGEGYNSGKTAIFCRFSGCNLWNGRQGSKKNSICNFCDTDFVGINGINGGKYNLDVLIKKICSLWTAKSKEKFIVLTGGEPLLQVDLSLIKELKKNNFYIALETNGTIIPPEGINWICVSPKIGSNMLLKNGNEIKIIYPQTNLDLKYFEKLEFEHFYIQPLDNLRIKRNTKMAISYVLNNPKWKLSIQSHKYLGIM